VNHCKAAACSSKNGIRVAHARHGCGDNDKALIQRTRHARIILWSCCYHARLSMILSATSSSHWIQEIVQGRNIYSDMITWTHACSTLLCRNIQTGTTLCMEERHNILTDCYLFLNNLRIYVGSIIIFRNVSYNEQIWACGLFASRF